MIDLGFGSWRPVPWALRAAPVLLLGLLAAPAPAQKLDCANAVAQPDLNDCAVQSWERADARLNDAYAAALARAGGPGDEDRLRAAQRAWIVFRDAACEAEAPLEALGQMTPMLHYGCLEHLTLQRAADLDRFGLR